MKRLTKLVRYAYVNTHSEAGKPTKVEFYPEEVSHINVWFNSYGNPTYMFYMLSGDRYMIVDDFGAMMYIKHLSRQEVLRKKDL